MLALIQQAVRDSGDAVLAAQGGGGASSLGNFWNLVEQAGPLRWPIFAVLAVGLVLVIGKLYDLVRDRALARPLFETDYRSVGLAQIASHVAKQRESMLASLQSAMLNVYQTRPSEGMLHDEIANFVAFQQDQFGVFRRRMEFLSDTAGALGLMGTVWGMFQVFFQGTTEKDVILRGMGIALITTLLGLVVSIILNLSATELSTFFGKRLEQVSKKSDELRFRLLELSAAGQSAPAPGATGGRPSAAAKAPAAAREARPTSPPSTREPAPRESERRVPAPAQPHATAWYLEPEHPAPTARAGETLRGLVLRLRREDGKPVSGSAVTVSLPADGGTLNGGGRNAELVTDAQGQVRVDWQLPTRAGTYSAQVAVRDRPGVTSRVDARVEPGEPRRIEAEGNNQAAVAGMRLAHPLAVRVCDQHGNPVPGVPVTFTVKRGAGRLGPRGGEAVVTTDAEGRAYSAFAVASDAGQNVVEAAVDGRGDAITFVAFGTEV